MARKLLLRPADHFAACPGGSEGPCSPLDRIHTSKATGGQEGLFSMPSPRVTSGSDRRCSTPWNWQHPPILCKRHTAGLLSAIRQPWQQSMRPDGSTVPGEISAPRLTGRDTAPNDQAGYLAFLLELTDWAGALLSGERAAVPGKVFCIAAVSCSCNDAKLPAAARFFI